MKQNITKEQLNELNEGSKCKIRHWQLKPMEGLTYCSEDISPLLSIGQMIEFLDERGVLKWIINDKDFIGTGVPMWLVDCRRNNGSKQYKSSKLCNSLWLVVKEELEKDA